MSALTIYNVILVFQNIFLLVVNGFVFHRMDGANFEQKYLQTPLKFLQRLEFNDFQVPVFVVQALIVEW